MKKLQGFEDIGLTVDHSHQIAYGRKNGYTFLIHYLSNQRQYTLVTTVKGDNEDILSTYLHSLDQENFINWTNYKEETLMINVKNTKELSVYDFDTLMNNISSFCQMNGYEAACHQCHEKKPVNIYSISGNSVLMCEDCYQKITSSLPDPQTVNTPMGVLGALAGSLIGVIVWVVIYKLGYIAGITGFIMAVCCFKGYELLGGRIDKKGLYIALIIAVVMLAFAEMIALGLEIHSAMNDYYEVNILQAFGLIPLFLSEGEVIGGVVIDLLSGYLFMAIASFSYVKAIHQAVKTEGVNERIG